MVCQVINDLAPGARFYLNKKKYIVRNWNRAQIVWAGLLYTASGNQCDQFDLTESQLPVSGPSTIMDNFFNRMHKAPEEVLKESIVS